MNAAPPLPPPPVPQPSVPAKRSALWIGCIVAGSVVLLIFLVAAIAGVAAPKLLQMRKKGDQVMAVSYGRTLSLMMFDFELEYGRFPDRETAKEVSDRTHHGLDLSGDHSNDYFRQLIAAGIANSEDPFCVPSAFSRRRPDNRMTGGQALAPGEVGWGYVMNGDASLPKGSLDIPLLVAPLSPTVPGRFDRSHYQAQALAIYQDGSAKMLPVDRDGRALTETGQALLEPGEGGAWRAGVRPVIKPPAMP